MLCIRAPLGTFTSIVEDVVAQAWLVKKATGVSPTLRTKKAGWFIIHHKERRLLLKTNPSMIVIEDSVAAGLRIYPYVKKKYFHKPANLGIGGD